MRIHLVLQDESGYYDYVCDGGGDGFPLIKIKKEKRKLGILLYKINKSDFENWPVENHLKLVDEKEEIETNLQLKIFQHLLDKGQDVGNCSHKSQELFLQLMFDIFQLHQAGQFSHEKLELLVYEPSDNKLGKRFFKHHLQKKYVGIA